MKAAPNKKQKLYYDGYPGLAYSINMQPSIFGKPLSEVTFDDVVTFCNGRLKEGLGLDYKKDLSSLPSIVKALVSFANTNGGWLVIGVEDENDAPKLPVTGMEVDENTTQKVINSIVSTVSPIISPFFQECISDDGKRAFLIAYMPQSTGAPHWMEYKKKNILFIRVADRASGEEWEQYAAGGQWEMLRRGRRQSADLRSQLIGLMKDVFESNARADEREAEEKRRSENTGLLSGLSLAPVTPYFAGRHYRGAQTISISPAHPNEPVSDVPTVRHFIANEAIQNGIANRHPLTPNHLGYDTKIYQKGAYSFHPDSQFGGKHYFFGLDTYGNLMNVDPIEKYIKRTGDEGKTIHLYVTEVTWVVMDIVGALKFADKFYKEAGFIGDLVIRIEFDGEEGCLIYFPDLNWGFDENNPPANAVGSYLIEERANTLNLSDNNSLISLTTTIIKEILYSFNYLAYEQNKDRFDAVIKQAARLNSGN